jgi:UDP-N-acetylmuramyl pentapeptide phosphotransferase/UDP-N-acetylglucosamine-1-phosphate transferase
MLYLLSEMRDALPVLNLLKYLTFRTFMATATGFIIAVAMGSRFIAWMRARQGKGQPIRKEGIERHVIEKAGTPTMGGLMILAGMVGGTMLWADLSNIYVWVVLMVTLAFGVLGFMDDYDKVTKQTTAGVSGRVKLGIQALVAVAAAPRWRRPAHSVSTICPVASMTSTVYGPSASMTMAAASVNACSIKPSVVVMRTVLAPGRRTTAKARSGLASLPMWSSTESKMGRSVLLWPTRIEPSGSAGSSETSHSVPSARVPPPASTGNVGRVVRV